MTDPEQRELTEFLAMKVMGWEKEQKSGTDYWMDVVRWGRSRVHIASSGNPVSDFNPLHSRNDMARVRAKMREMGYSFSRNDVTNRDGSLFFDGPYETDIGKDGMFVCSAASKDELMAEGLAIREAVK